MNGTVILAEKPSQAKAYSECFHTSKSDGYYEVFPNPIFPNGAIITYGIGHLVELKEPHEYNEKYKKWELADLPIIPTNFEFRVSPDKKKQFNIVKKLLGQAQLIIVATDSDREGENIARSIINMSGVGNKPIKRLWINSLEKEEVLRGFKNLLDGNDFIPMYHEAMSRQIGDWLVGLNASRLFTLSLQKKGVNEVFSVGRVQTPTLRLIYDRQKEIENFKPEKYFEIEALFSTSKGSYKGKLEQRFKDMNSVHSLFEKHSIHSSSTKGFIQDLKTTTKHKKPPKLHSLSTLQTLANKKYKYSPSKVLKIVQSLYDSPLKLVSYPRTDTQYITTNEFNYLRKNFEEYKKVLNVEFSAKTLEPTSRYVNNSKVQEHYAIIPTKNIPTNDVLTKLSDEQKNIYFEIVRSVLAMFHHDHVYEETEITTNVNELLFLTKGSIVKDNGWKTLFQHESDSNDETTHLPPVTKNMECNAELKPNEKQTSPPKPFTEGQLINVMKYCGKYVNEIDDDVNDILKEIEGLGTEATRSGIIDTLKQQKYIEVKKNAVYVTKKGEILCNSVEGTLLAKPDMTAKWESYLKNIGKQTGDMNTFINNVIAFTKKLVNDITPESLNVEHFINEMKNEKHIAKCPTCNQGFIIDKGKLYGCERFKDGCKQTFPKKMLGKSITKSHVKQLCEKRKTSLIKGFKGKKEFNAHLILVDGNVKFDFQ